MDGLARSIVRGQEHVLHSISPGTFYFGKIENRRPRLPRLKAGHDEGRRLVMIRVSVTRPLLEPADAAIGTDNFFACVGQRYA